MFKKFRFNFISGITKQDFFLIKFGHCKCQKKHVLANFFLKDGKKKSIPGHIHYFSTTQVIFTRFHSVSLKQ